MATQTWQERIIEHGELYVVGGSVRDELIGLRRGEEDIDYLVRGLPPDELERLLEPLGRLVLVGKSFGVYKFRPAGSTSDVDIAYPRKERSTGHGHRDFKVDWDWLLPAEDDLVRRDFTINAVARRINDGTLVDPCGGARDIAARTVRMIFPKAFEEDPLRILRGVRFAATLEFDIDAATFAAMSAATSLLSTVSAERVQEELSKLLTRSRHPSIGIDRLYDVGGLVFLIPELARAHGVEQNEYHPDDVYWHSLKSCDCAPMDNLVVRWAALLHDLGKVDAKRRIAGGDGERIVFYGHEQISARLARDILERLRYSNGMVARCCRLIEHHMFFYQPEWTAATVRRFVRRVGEEHLEDLFLLREADSRSRQRTEEVDNVGDLRARIQDEFAQRAAFRISDLAIDGRDVMRELGITEGRVVGAILTELLERVLETPSLNERDTLLRLLREQKR